MSDAYKVSYSPLAQDDIRAIFTYIAFELQAEQAAQGQVNRIREAVRKLDTMPERHEIVGWGAVKLSWSHYCELLSMLKLKRLLEMKAILVEIN